MEKLRVFLEQFQKYHFWVVCGLIVLISSGAWFFATGAVASRFEDGKKKIDTAISAANAIRGPDHPNEAYIKGILDITSGSLQGSVDGGEGLLYREQRHSNSLPVLFPTTPESQSAFEADFWKNWKPIQEMLLLKPDELGSLYRQRYRNHVTQIVFPQPFKLIERRTEAPPDPSNPGQNNNSNQSKEMVGIVDWEGADAKISALQSRMSGGDPTTLDVLMVQEELWVYETLLNVIHNTNNASDKPGVYEKPSSHKVARIKQILAMDIGKDAVQAWKGSERALMNLGEADAGAAQPMRAAPAGPPSAAAAALAGRYVDDKGHPLDDPDQQPFPEFRMMPINLKVVIEQKEIPRLLAECANSAMRIDIRGVRILVDDPPSADVTGTGETTAAPAPTPGPPPPMMPTQPGPSRSDPRRGRGGPLGGGRGFVNPPPAMVGAAGGTKGEFAYNEESVDPIHPPVPVEVQGIIYIYNKPAEPAEKPGSPKPGSTAAGANAAAPAVPGTSTTTAPGASKPAAPRGAPATPASAAGKPAPAPGAQAAPAPAKGPVNPTGGAQQGPAIPSARAKSQSK